MSSTSSLLRVVLVVALSTGPISSYPLHADEPEGRPTSSAGGQEVDASFASIGLEPMPDRRPSPHVIVQRRRSYAGYSVENVALETLPAFYCTGNLYRPLQRHDLGPILLIADSVDSPQRDRADRQVFCAHLARLGATVFACNTTWDYGENGNTNSQVAQRVEIWNSLRIMDFLASLSRVDIDRIAVAVPRGTQLKALDDRILLAIEQIHDFAPNRREALYTLLARQLLLERDQFYAEPLEPQLPPDQLPGEDRDSITVESELELTSFDAGHDVPTTLVTTLESADSALSAYLQKLRGTASQHAAVLTTTDSTRAEYTYKTPGPEDEAIVFTPPGFDRPGVRKVASGPSVGRLKIAVRDSQTNQPTPCRVNVVGSDGNFYEPEHSRLKEHSLTAVWPDAGWGNRPLRAPIRYLGRFFYSTGEAAVEVPAGQVRVEVFKGFEYRPETVTIFVPSGQTRRAEIVLSKTAAMESHGYWSGDPHIHIQRHDELDQSRIFDLLECEDTHHGLVLAYNEPPGPYAGFMNQMDSPQAFGLGRRSIATRGAYSILSGQEYRSSHYGHLNLFLLDRLVLPDQSLNADDWPTFGLVGRMARQQGGVAFYAHGGYSLEVYADIVQGDVDGVELLQHGVYRGIGLDGWYDMLNTGYRVPANGAADYPACRKLADCQTFVHAENRPTIDQWVRGMAEGNSFFSSGPLLLLDVADNRPGSSINQPGAGPHRVTARVRVRSEVAPVTDLLLIANGRIIDHMHVPPGAGHGNWIHLERDIELHESTWIAARAFSLSRLGTPDAEAHTNPVYVNLNDRAPYDRASLDRWLAAIDGQITRHKERTFDEQAKVLAYFERSRDILVKIRAAGGVPAGSHPATIAATLTDIEDPTARTHTDEQLKALLQPMPPRPLHEFVKSLETADGFEMQVVAHEPDVTDPVAAAFDEDGNLFVCEMRDYPYKPAADEQPLGRVRLLIDSDGDGTFDDSHVFAEHLLWAAGVVPWNGGIFVAASPDIWYLKDTDGDHRADIRRRVYTGFGTQNQQAMVNNLAWGLDHMIYGSTAGNGGTIRCLALASGHQPAEYDEVNLNGRDFRFDPRSGLLEAVTGTMQFGNAFDDWGNRFLCSESQPLLHAVLPHHYLVRNPYLPVSHAVHNIAPGPVPIFRTSPLERWRIIRSSRRIAHGERSAEAPGASHHVIDAAAGVTIYRGGAYPDKYYGNVFVGGAQNNLIHRRTLSRDGVTFNSARADANTEFVRSHDAWFRPVNFVNAPDGTLYVLDMSREILESIHVPADVAKFLDFKSGRQQGRIYRLAPPNFMSPEPPALGHATTTELVTALQSPHGWYRDTAHRLLYERQDPSAVPALRRLLVDGTLAPARLHALWSLHGLDALTAQDLTVAMKDGHAACREHAMRLAEPWLDQRPELLDFVIAGVDDNDLRIRFQTAFSLGASHDPRAARALARMVRMGDSDNWIQTAILSSAGELAGELLFNLLADDQSPATGSDQQVAHRLATVVGARNDAAEVERFLDQLADLHEQHETQAEALLISFGTGLQSSGSRLDSNSLSSAQSASFWRNTLVNAHSVAHRSDITSQQRLPAIRLLSLAPFSQTRESLAQLLQVIHPEEIQTAAVRALASYSDPAVSELLLKRWREYPPAVRDEAISALLTRAEWTAQLLQAAGDETVTLSNLDSTQRSQLIDHQNREIRSLAQRTLGTSGFGARDDVIADYAAALQMETDTHRGETVFRRDCMNCHKIGDIGHAVGPDLTSSASRDGDALLVHVLDPNRYVLPRYENYICVDKDGRIITGLLSSQTATSIHLKQQGRQAETILRTNIDELTSTGKSLMPEGFEAKISRQEMADLLAFLQASQKSATHSPLDIGTLPGMIEPTE